MAQLDRLGDALKLLGAARNLAVEKRRYQWDVQPPNTFFLHAEHADIHLKPHDQARAVATIELRGGFVWQVATEQDAAGVYIIARRKRLVGNVGLGRFTVLLPPGIHISLKLTNCRLRMDGLNGDIDFPPSLYESS
ncbi:MAG: hypothetical protein OXE95_03445 [Chloroflexi bacterium]|nr:hypothetical protein [Chloroflexota bacterium]MCY4246617.1 hypothetical protein [Chloroflexota bacterium]